jgi:hypothetical protein
MRPGSSPVSNYVCTYTPTKSKLDEKMKNLCGVGGISQREFLL